MNVSAPKHGIVFGKTKKEKNNKIFESFFFFNFLEINTHNFVKRAQNFKIRAYLMQNVMELDTKKFSDPKVLILGV